MLSAVIVRNRTLNIRLTYLPVYRYTPTECVQNKTANSCATVLREIGKPIILIQVFYRFISMSDRNNRFPTELTIFCYYIRHDELVGYSDMMFSIIINNYTLKQIRRR